VRFGVVSSAPASDNAGISEATVSPDRSYAFSFISFHFFSLFFFFSESTAVLNQTPARHYAGRLLVVLSITVFLPSPLPLSFLFFKIHA